MHKLFKVPLIFLFVAACLGLFLRFQLMAPINGIVYSNVLHAHSHVMFLGWVFNVLVISFSIEFAPPRSFKILFWFLQCCVVGMLMAFPVQGYGLVSIIISALHTFGALVLIVLFFVAWRGRSSLSLTFARAALLFFALSSIGPFVLGYLKANALDYTDLNRYSVYFYLHFQYNGFFLFGVLSLFFKLIEGETSRKDLRSLTIGGYMLLSCCLPAYLLSILWSQPGLVFNVIGSVAAFAQLIALCFFIRPVISFTMGPSNNDKMRFSREVKLLLAVSFASLAVKSILQLISAHPAAAALANEFRAIVIAYLHLVLLGFISMFLMAWLIGRGVLKPVTRLAITLILVGFIASEVILVMSPWSDPLLGVPMRILNQLLVMFSIMMMTGTGLLLPYPNRLHG